MPVEKYQVTDETILAPLFACQATHDESGRCFQFAANAMLSRASFPQVLDTIAKNESNPYVYERCHITLHYLSQLEYKKVKNLQTVFSKCIPTCLEGCYHGAVEGYFIDKQIPLDQNDAISREIPVVCGKSEQYEKKEIYNQCLHGIGHAVMFLTGSDVPRSLHLCDALNAKNTETLCYTGVFMENTNNATDPTHPTRFIKKEDPMYPCNIVDTSYQTICYALQTSYFFKLTNFDWNKTAALCAKEPDQYQPPCYTTMGSNQIGYISDLKKVAANCSSLLSDGKKQCVQGVVSHLLIRFGGRYEQSFEFCKMVDDSFKKYCYFQLGLTLKEWVDSSQQDQICQKFAEDTYGDYCRNTLLI